MKIYNSLSPPWERVRVRGYAINLFSNQNNNFTSDMYPKID
jgi:hypothetical protein